MDFTVSEACPTDIYPPKIARHTDPMSRPPNDAISDHTSWFRALSGLILNTILKIVEDLGDPYQAKPGLGGMAYPPGHDRRLHPEAEARTYRKMVGHLRMNRGLAMKIGLPKIPSKSTIWRAYGMIPEQPAGGPHEDHRRRHGDRFGGRGQHGYSSNRFVRWFSIRHDQVRLKRGWVKLHSIVDVSTRTVLDYLVTDGYRHHRKWPMLGRIEEGARLLLPGLGLPGQGRFDAISDKGMTRIRPKSNTVCKNWGSRPGVI